MAHANQERYSALVDAKLRATLVTRDGAIFNTRYEGSPKAGKVKIPVRDTEVAVKAYDKANGVDADAGTTTYLDLDIDNDEAVNEIIDGFDAASVPDGITAERLDSAAYSMALSIDKKSIEALQSATGATISATKTACTASTAYKEALAAKRTLSRNGVPQTGRFMIVSPEYLEILMQDDKFIKQGDLSQQLVQTGESRTDIGFIHNNWTQGIRFGGGTGNDLTAMNWMLAHQGIYYRSTELQDNGYTYDYFSPDFLFDDDVYFNTETQTIEKAGYKALVLYQNWLDVKGAERILEWAKQGLKVVGMENAAVRTPFNDGSDEQLASIMTELKSLPTVRVAEIYDASEGFRYEDQVATG